MDELTEAGLDAEGRLSCSLCERDCSAFHVSLELDGQALQVACPGCAASFRAIVGLALAAARQLCRRQRELDERETKAEEETRG